MSYGRDPKTLGAVGSYRQAASKVMKRPKSGSKGGGGFLFRDTYKPSLISPDMIRLVPGNYSIEVADDNHNVEVVSMPNYKYVKHYHARTKRTCVCSGGALSHVRGKRLPCLGCENFWDGMHTDASGKKKRGPMGMTDEYVFNVLHYAGYHEVEQVDRDTGQVKMGPQNKPYTEWVVCLQTYGVACPPCQQGKAMSNGRLLHWPLGYAHYNSLLAIDDQIGRSCSTCQQMDTIKTLAWLCQNEQCGEAIIEVGSTQHKPEDVKKLTVDKVTCPKCGFFGYLGDYYECQTCKNPKRATLFDVDMNALRVEEGAGDNKKTHLQISRWSQPRPIDERFRALAKPMQLEKIYAPTPIDIQARVWNLPLPATTQPQQTQQQQQQQQPAQTPYQPYQPQRMPPNDFQPPAMQPQQPLAQPNVQVLPLQQQQQPEPLHQPSVQEQLDQLMRPLQGMYKP